MKRAIPYSNQERRVIGERPGLFGGPPVLTYNTPVNPRENSCALYFDKSPYWVSGNFDVAFVMPEIYNKNLGRSKNDTDCFGRFWEWVESAGGSITHTGNPLFTDVNEWKEHIVIPDIDAWDWEKAALDTVIDTHFSPMVSLVNGFWFERMISWMDFIPAAMALIDEDQQGAILEMFEATTSLACKVVDKIVEYFPCVDGINIHDDWGSQKAPFFSEAIARKLFLPFMKRLNDHIHSKGRYTSLHSCGHSESRIQVFIDAGYDEWQPQTMNDTAKLYEEYGDKILLSISPPALAPDATDADYRQAARDFVARFCKPGKPALLGITPLSSNAVFRGELYESSRKLYAGI